jgi:hypothetical protein
LSHSHEVMDTLFYDKPTLGLVIGTYGSPAYVHLHLQNANRLYPGLPTLVHDDGSRESDNLSQICFLYDADFISSSENRGHQLGDLACFNEGLKWAEEKKLDVLVKMSRRWLPLRDWREELSNLCMEGQYASYTSYCEYHRLFFRTECIALHVPSWCKFRHEIEEASKTGDPNFPSEEFMYRLGKRVHSSILCKAGTYVQWPLVNNNRFTRNPDVLWHDYASSQEYYDRSQELGLDYKLKNFEL